MAYTGTYRAGGATFNDQQVAEEFQKALRRSTPGFQGLRAGQFFTGEGGTQYKTVAGINPNQPGWGQMVDPDYQLIGYQGGAQPTGRARGTSQPQEGFAILKKIGQPATVEDKTTTEVTEEEDTSLDPTKLDVDVPSDPEGSKYDDIVSSFTDQITGLKDAFTTSLTTQKDQFDAMQKAQEDRMTALQNQMLAYSQMQDRPTTAGVKMATGAAGNAMQIARRGVTGAFGRRGMRISSLNV